MKIILRIIFAILLSTLAIGFYTKQFINYLEGEKIIGFGVFFGAFIFLPLFLYCRYKNKKIEDYTFTSKHRKKY